MFGAILISIGIHLMLLALTELIINGEINPHDIFLGSAATLSLMRGLAVFFAALGVTTFTVPGGILMGITLIALAILGYQRVGG